MSDEKPASVKLGGTIYLQSATLMMMQPGTEDADNPVPTGWVLEVAGPAHPRTVEINNRIAARLNKLSADKDKARVNGKKWTPAERDPEDVRREAVEDIANRIIGWSPDPDFEDGKGPIPFSDDAAVEIFMDRAKGSYFLQLVRFITEERSFLKASAKN
jgi:hypothetical protein